MIGAGDLGPGAVAGSGSVRAEHIAGRDVITFTKDDLLAWVEHLARQVAALKDTVGGLPEKHQETRAMVVSLHLHLRQLEQALDDFRLKLLDRTDDDRYYLLDRIESVRRLLTGNGHLGIEGQVRVLGLAAAANAAASLTALLLAWVVHRRCQ